MSRDAATSWCIDTASPEYSHVSCAADSGLVHCACSFIIITLFTYLFVCDIMGQKKMSAKDSGEKKKRMMSIEVNQEKVEK